MELVIALIAIDVIASKFLESYIKSQRPDSDQPNTSLFFGRLYQKMGIGNVVWISFFSTVFVVGVSIHLLNSFHTGTSLQLLYIFTGLFTTVLNLGSAHSTYFGRTNLITRKLLSNNSRR